MQRAVDFPGRSLTENMFQRGPGNLHQATKEGSLVRDDAGRSHLGKKADRKQRSKLAYRQQRASQKQGDNLELSEHQTMTAQQQSEISSEYSESSQSRRSSSSGVPMAGRPPKRNYARSRSSSSKHSQRGSSAGQQRPEQEFSAFYAHIQAETAAGELYDGQQEGRSASADQQTPQKRRKMKTPPEDPWKKMLRQRQIVRQMQQQ